MELKKSIFYKKLDGKIHKNKILRYSLFIWQTINSISSAHESELGPYVCIFEIEHCYVFKKNVVFSFGIKMTFWVSLIWQWALWEQFAVKGKKQDTWLRFIFEIHNVTFKWRGKMLGAKCVFVCFFLKTKHHALLPLFPICT